MPETGFAGLLGAGLVGLLIGLAAGVLVAVAFHRRSGTSRRELERIREEHERYRAEVDQHFARTSALFRELTERYRDLYEHMATGAQQLCRDQPRQPALDIPDVDLLGEGGSADRTDDTGSAGNRGRRTVDGRDTGNEEEQT